MLTFFGIEPRAGKAIFLKRAAGLGRRFLLDRRAVAAVEFAMVLPLMILIYAGAAEISQAVMTNSKVELIAGTIAQLTSQQATSTAGWSSDANGSASATSPSKLSSIMDAGGAIMAPGSATPLKMVLTAVDVTNNPSGKCCDAQVRWSYAQSTPQRPCGLLTKAPDAQAPSPTTIAASIIPNVPALANGTDGFARVSVIIADVSYPYKSSFSTYWFALAGNFTRTSYMFPRGAEQVVVATSSPGAAPIPATAANRSGQICY